MTVDSQSLSRLAQPLIVDFKRAYGAPPTYDINWTPLWTAKVDRVTINAEHPSTASIWFPDRRWDKNYDLLWGDMVRIRTDQPNAANRSVIFIGFVTGYDREFTGGSGEPGTSFERNAVICQDHRWLMAVNSVIYGQHGRGPDDYENYGTPEQSIKEDQWTPFSGRRTIFNLDGKPNKSPYTVEYSSSPPYDPTSLFTDPGHPDAEFWTAADMLWYLLSPIRTLSFDYLPIYGLHDLYGLHKPGGDLYPEWNNWNEQNKHLNNIIVDGLNSLDAILLLCKHLGWSFRLDYYSDSPDVQFVFYKNINAASGWVQKHRLYAPFVGDNLAAVAHRGEKLLWAASVIQDIGPVINKPIGLGAPHRFEFTAELVPAWKDASLVPDLNHLFFTESELAAMDNPDDYSFFRCYHSRGTQFRSDKDLRLVGRRWSLNEAGSYTKITAEEPTYDRGKPFDFATVIPEEFIKGDVLGDIKKLFGPFRRKLLNCLTVRPDDSNSIGIIVEFSFDAGLTWQSIPCSIVNLDDECGIYISEPNLSEIKPKIPAEISGGDLDGEELNYWTRICDDYLEERSFKNGNWKTRIRVTASAQMDRRIVKSANVTNYSGSPFDQRQLYDFSEKYGLVKRTSSSIFSSAGYNHPVIEADDTDICLSHISSVQKANEDIAISGRFTLERLWLGDGSGDPTFQPGDYIERITGRECDLGVAFGGGTVYPQIVQIIYLPEKQKEVLITRDLRFSEPQI